MKIKNLLCTILVLVITGTIFIGGYIQQLAFAQEQPASKIKPIAFSGIQAERLKFTTYYTLEPLDIISQVSQYKLPLQTNKISNFSDFSTKISLSNKALKLLSKNGFVVINNPFYSKEEYITSPYGILKNREIPIFITSDSLLHLYHIQFDETLRQIEEREFYDKIWKVSKELLDDSIEKYNSSTGDLKEAAKRNIAFFSVGLELLKPKAEQIQKVYAEDDWERLRSPLTDAFFTQEEKGKYVFTIPAFVKKDAEKELELIERHQGFFQSPLFIYKEDYSQYIPRGHYTRSEKLKNYFKAFMWYGRINMLLKGTNQVGPGEPCNGIPPCKALISLYDAKIQTMQACLIAAKFAESKELKDKWDRIYSVTAFYVGLSDDLGPYEYIEALNFVFKGKFEPNNLTEKNIGRLKAKLAEYRVPKIYGGTGDCTIWPPFTPEQADQVLEYTKGFRLMGQRFIPDSYMFQNLVFLKVGRPLGLEEPFTWVMSQAGPIRGFPRGLDVMALLGSKRARELLDELKDSNYKDYPSQLKMLKSKFDGFTQTDWNKNLYWSWLFALKPLLKEFDQGYPTFMQTKAWQDKELTTALASWAELRHDTILYAKQSSTMRTMAASPHVKPRVKPVVGYIEPVPEFYNRLLALTRMTTKGLDEMDVLDSLAKYRLESLEEILKRLVDLSKKELKKEK